MGRFFSISNFFINKISQGRKSVHEKKIPTWANSTLAGGSKRAPMILIFFNLPGIKSRSCENYLAEFCTSALLKPLKINRLHSKKQMVKLTNPQEKLSHNLDLRIFEEKH